MSEMRSHYRNVSNGNDVSRCVLNDHLADRWHIGHRKARVWETFVIILQKMMVVQVVEVVRSSQFLHMFEGAVYRTTDMQ